MTVRPPGLIAAPEHPGTVVVVERPAPVAAAASRWSVWSVVFVVLTSLSVLAVGLAVRDLLAA
jgi:hypothetical protein